MLEKGNKSSSEELNRIRKVRLSQGITIEDAARMMKKSTAATRESQRETADLKLTELYQWAAVLDIDITELIVDENFPPSARISAHRLMLSQWMKAVLTIDEEASQKQIKIFAQRCMQHLLQLRPDLNSIIQKFGGPQLEQPEVVEKKEHFFDPQNLHQIGEVRKREGISRRTMVRYFKAYGLSSEEIMHQEEQSTDLQITDVRRWASALALPVRELFYSLETGIADETRDKAAMVKLVKSMKSLQEVAAKLKKNSIVKITGRILDDVYALLPEFENVSPWPIFGQTRGTDDLGRVVRDQYSAREGGQFGWDAD